ncbi:MAG: UDP-glycosyltransferase [Gillisia sp.]
MKSKKIFILLPDGVGLRNFAFTSFVEIGEKLGWEVLFWNQTPFDLTNLGYKEIKLEGKPRAFTDLLKRAKKNVELDYFEEKFNDKVYQTYKFPSSNKGIKSKIKNVVVKLLTKAYRGEKGIEKLRENLKISERKSVTYKNCKKVLETEKPDFIFCTNQRPVNSIAPLTAAQDLGIPTSTFIFSWDNLPKATMVVEPDFYFVWSEYMKEELLNYYPFISSKNIFISGSPQFEPHYNSSLRQSREEFFNEHGLDFSKEYICFSGDDITTSPDDPQYLNDVSEAVENLNKSGKNNLGIIFRRCPVDFSARYDEVLEKYKDLIVPIAPKWVKVGGRWNAILPTKEDLHIQVNTILHTQAVINLGSSMVFDFAVYNKPCLFLNYDVENKVNENWSTKKIYQFVHFRSMPTGNEVFWINTKKEITSKLELALNGVSETVAKANRWFQKINLPPAEKASERIWEKIEQIHNKCT